MVWNARRSALVAVARKRVRARYGLGTETPAVLIGDTPRDVEAALISGAHIVAVASGEHRESELRHASAELVLSDLLDLTGLMRHLRELDVPPP
ncbi:HAD family hydrolase [Streptomyces cremeus]|uniref:HAD family hydrolase n=1 Tax=Streptomyces cremeus TaxID=66881 RepID=A0ABV5P777_STRCM